MKNSLGNPLSQDAEIEEILAHNIRARRFGKNWTQKELARITSLSSAMIEHLEGGRRWASKETIHVLARAFGCKTWELYRRPATPHFEQLTWQHAREVLDRELSRLEFLNTLPPEILEDLIQLAKIRKISAIEQRIKSLETVEKKPEYQTRSIALKKIKSKERST